jgi:hypothetical protein
MGKRFFFTTSTIIFLLIPNISFGLNFYWEYDTDGLSYTNPKDEVVSSYLINEEKVFFASIVCEDFRTGQEAELIFWNEDERNRIESSFYT